jgi:DNA polymerase III alpha subunit
MRCIAWPEDYARYEELIKPESVIIVAGKVDRRSREPNLLSIESIRSIRLTKSSLPRWP